MFGAYLEETFQIIVDGNKVTKWDVGTYEISLVAEFTKDVNKMIRKHAVLLITIYDPSDTWCG